MHQSGFPPGVFNLINGDGEVGKMLAVHPGTDMTSFTGSTKIGKSVYKAGAENFKKVSLELGGKGAFLLFADYVLEFYQDGASNDVEENDTKEERKDDNIDSQASLLLNEEKLEEAISRCIHGCFENNGQSCNAPTRLLVERSIYKAAIKVAKEIALGVRVDSAHEEGDHLGPVISNEQFENIQSYIQSGIEEGATLIVGGFGHPESDPDDDINGSNTCNTNAHEYMHRGYYVRPTVFVDCHPEMKVMQEEIFGPVLCVAPFDTEEEAVDIANGTPYGLTNYLYTSNASRRRRVSRKLKSGVVETNGVYTEAATPFGGIRASGNGREGGVFGLEGFCDVKAVMGY